MGKHGKNLENSSNSALEHALGGWRRAETELPEERLSAGARAELLARVRIARDEIAEAPLAPMFLPFRRAVGLAAVPALLIAVSLGLWIGRAPGAQPAPVISSSKVGGEAVFRIANGGKMHRVYRADSARATDGADVYTTTSDTFRDTLSGGTSVVYYRID